MFTRDRLPDYFIKDGEEPRFHRMAPVQMYAGETILDWRVVDPRKNPSHWVRQWHPTETHATIVEATGHTDKTPYQNYFLHHPAPKGYAVNMWMNGFTGSNWMYLWYWRAVVWHDFVNKGIIEGAWWMAATWANARQDANTYYMLFENENDMTVGAAYLAGLDCSVHNLGK